MKNKSFTQNNVIIALELAALQLSLELRENTLCGKLDQVQHFDKHKKVTNVILHTKSINTKNHGAPNGGAPIRSNGCSQR